MCSQWRARLLAIFTRRCASAGRWFPAAAWMLVSLIAVGCGAHHSIASKPAPQERAQTSADEISSDAARPPSPRLPPTTTASMIESIDPRLSAALQTAILTPSPATYRALAAEYKRLGIFDKAESYLTSARDLAPKDPATSDALARLWRDAGFARLGLADAQRAVSYAPQSPVVHNTLGTILQALGERSLAITEFERALALDPKAAYALNNLCYAWLLQGDPQRATAACNKALAIDPKMTAARNNLALAYAAAGQNGAARATFEAAGDPAAARYNQGIVHLAQKNYRSAVDAFAEAHKLRPSMTDALARARQASALAASAGE